MIILSISNKKFDKIFRIFCSTTRPAGSGKAMKLGSKNKDIDLFVDMLKSEGEGLYKILLTLIRIYLDFCFLKSLIYSALFSVHIFLFNPLMHSNLV